MPSTIPREQWRERTENARREARYKHAEQRVRKIATGDPALTDEQRARLARILVGESP
jgi:precorrin-6B methylase 1